MAQRELACRITVCFAATVVDAIVAQIRRQVCQRVAALRSVGAASAASAGAGKAKTQQTMIAFTRRTTSSAAGGAAEHAGGDTSERSERAQAMDNTALLDRSGNL